MASRIVQYFADKLKTVKEYPITLTKAVYDENGERLDDILDNIIDKIDDNSDMLAKANKDLTVNLLNPTLQTTTVNGVTCTNNGDGTYTLNGICTETETIPIAHYNMKKGKYKIIGCPLGGGTDTYCLKYDNSVPPAENNIDIGNGLVFDTEEAGYFVAIRMAKGYTFNNLVFKPMITTNLSAQYDDFVPYTGSTGSLNGDVAEIKRNTPTLANNISVNFGLIDKVANKMPEIAFDIEGIRYLLQLTENGITLKTNKSGSWITLWSK